MNKLEFALMNNPLRRLIQRIEVRRMKNVSRFSPDANHVLEIGCGSGHGTKLILKHFSPKKINAIDLDPKMISVANKKNLSSRVTFSVGDAANLSFDDNSFDAVFDFGIIHHIPNWKDCLDELLRVLKPGGKLILEDLSIETFQTVFGKVLRRLLDHPYKEMFQRDQFIQYLEKIGFRIEQKKLYDPLGLLKYFLVVAKK